MLDAERNYREEPYTILCFGDSNTWGCVPKWQETATPSLRYMSHRPLDMVLLMLGTNDLHVPICPMEHELGEGVRALIRVIDAYPDACEMVCVREFC